MCFFYKIVKCHNSIKFTIKIFIIIFNIIINIIHNWFVN